MEKTVLKRINLDTIAEAFAQAGQKPRAGAMWACPMGIVTGGMCTKDFEEKGFHEQYALGVMDGWDWGQNGKSIWRHADKNSLEYKIGRADGIAARKLLNPS